jgi:sugar/nucleoside kinase (ribokinase family)
LDTTYDVLIQGNPFCDLTFTFTDREALPSLGQEVYAQNFAINPGGVLNISSALTRLGLCVGLKTQLGNDIFSRYLGETMRESGISSALTTWIDQPLPVITVGVSFPHDRLFLSYGPVGQIAPPRITVDDLDRYRPRAVFTHGEVGIEICRAARERGILVYLDSNWDPAFLHSSDLWNLLSEVDVFSPNTAEALEITGASGPHEALDRLRERCPCVAITRGADGVLAWCDGREFRLPAIPVHAIETTGAGDNFNAGLLYGLLGGHSFERSLHYATIAGGLSTLVPGGYRSECTPEILEEWMHRVKEGVS